MQPRDIRFLRHVPKLDVTATGEVIAAVTHPDLATDQNVSVLREFSAADQPSRLLTRGPDDSNPQLSSCGRWLAFLRPAPATALDDSDPQATFADAPQLHVVDARGGEARCVTQLPLGVRDFRWLPNAEAFVLSAEVPHVGSYRRDIPAAAQQPRDLPPYI
ncbi:MAG: hypothetical protein Q4Q03_07450, partial [Bowdeniella nasicola]|nr:hypothetical protein [Bowdeniella nasicola]